MDDVREPASEAQDSGGSDGATTTAGSGGIRPLARMLPTPVPCRAFLGTPMRHRDTPVGGFFLGEREGGVTDRDETVLMLFAQQAADAERPAGALRMWPASGVAIARLTGTPGVTTGGHLGSRVADPPSRSPRYVPETIAWTRSLISARAIPSGPRVMRVWRAQGSLTGKRETTAHLADVRQRDLRSREVHPHPSEQRGHCRPAQLAAPRIPDPGSRGGDTVGAGGTP